MRILVTGGTGFIGSAFVQRARAAGHTLAILSRQPVPPPSDIIWLTGSLAQAPWREIESFHPEVCVHAAWLTTPPEYWHSPENENWRTESETFLNRLGATGVSHCLVLGSCAEYGNENQPLQEDSLCFPVTPYGEAKQALHVKLSQDFPDRLSWARVFYCYGLGEHPARFCSSVIATLRRHQPLSLKTPFDILDFVHVTDVAAALLAIVENRPLGTINVGSGKGISIGRLAKKIAAKLGRGIAGDSSEQTAAPRKVVADITKLSSLGWQPRVTLDTGLEEMICACE